VNIGGNIGGPVGGATNREPTTTLETTIAIVGSGFAGLGMAIQLRKRGLDDFLILEKSHDIGGTWRENTYPGCGCDVPTVLYSFSFEQNPHWSKMWASQPEIQAYLQRTTDKYDLRRVTVFGAEVVKSDWDDTTSRWHLRTGDGRTITAQFVVVGIGPLHRPNIPQFNGIESFAGPVFHSAQWDHGVDLSGKRVAVIGTGASAVQFVPAIAEQVGQLQLYQRSPPWVVPRPDPVIPVPLRRLFAKVPVTRLLFRKIAFGVAELLGLGISGYTPLHKLLERAARGDIRKNIRDPVLAVELTPTYPLGCKRVLLSPNYYSALARSNVEVVTDGIDEIVPGGIRTADGIERPVDVIVYATGFRITDAFDGLDIRGTGGESLVRRWDTEGIKAHLGTTIAGMPNMFLLLGPNSGIVYTSLVFVIEQQIKHVLRAMDIVKQRGAASIGVRHEAQDAYTEMIRRWSAKKVWAQGACTNWFLDDGVNVALWPGYSWQYWRLASRVDEAAFVIAGQDAAGERDVQLAPNHELPMPQRSSLN
jgi:cation diffusion facilitator CzcD-associated flavoprotein CzcO